MQSDNTKKHKVLIYAICEVTITNNDPAEAQAIAEKLFHDDISSKSEMFLVRVEEVEVQPLQLTHEHKWEVIKELPNAVQKRCVECGHLLSESYGDADDDLELTLGDGGLFLSLPIPAIGHDVSPDKPSNNFKNIIAGIRTKTKD
jgi:hypothetical protein